MDSTTPFVNITALSSEERSQNEIINSLRKNFAWAAVAFGGFLSLVAIILCLYKYYSTKKTPLPMNNYDNYRERPLPTVTSYLSPRLRERPLPLLPSLEDTNNRPPPRVLLSCNSVTSYLSPRLRDTSETVSLQVSSPDIEIPPRPPKRDFVTYENNHIQSSKGRPEMNICVKGDVQKLTIIQGTVVADTFSM